MYGYIVVDKLFFFMLSPVKFDEKQRKKKKRKLETYLHSDVTVLASLLRWVPQTQSLIFLSISKTGWSPFVSQLKLVFKF